MGFFNEDKRLLAKLADTQVKDHLAEPTEQALLALLQQDFAEKHASSQNLLLAYLRIVFRLGVTPIEEFAGLLLTEANYRDVDCLDDFNSKLKEEAARVAES